jgi:hypothetical protein
MNESELASWQSNTHMPGELLSTWDNEASKDIPCLVIQDNVKTIDPYGRKIKIRRIMIMSKHGVYEVSKYEIFPSGEASPSIRF